MARNKQFNEEEVLQKAVEIFWKQGYNATSMDDLVKHLGINRASLYDTFGGKKNLFQQAINKYITDNTKALEGVWGTDIKVRDGIQTLFNLVIEGAVTDPDLKGCLVVNTSTELLPYDKEIHEALSLNKSNFERAFCQYLKKGQEKGEIHPGKDINVLSAFLLTLFNGLKVTAKIKPERESMTGVVKLALQALD